MKYIEVCWGEICERLTVKYRLCINFAALYGRKRGCRAPKTVFQRWSIRTRGKPQETIPPNCIKPTTTSSPMSSTGQFAYIEAGELKQRDVGKAEAFGCQ